MNTIFQKDHLEDNRSQSDFDSPNHHEDIHEHDQKDSLVDNHKHTQKDNI